MVNILFRDFIFKLSAISFCILVKLICPVKGDLNFNNDVENNKNFKSVPTTVKTFENDTVLLPCYHHSSFRYVRWNRDDVPLVDSRHPEIPPPERIHLWSNGSLQVSRVKSEDTGEYYCEIMGTTGGHAVQVHAIEVQYPPSIISSPSGVVELPIGAVFEIVCEAKGMPHPTITWKRSGAQMNTNSNSDPNKKEQQKIDNSRRTLVEVESREMSGPIECTASNGVGNPVTAGIHLIVLFKPEVRAIQSTVHTKIGMRAHLECHVVAAPAATVQWFHHGVPIHPNIRVARNDVELQSNRSLSHYYTTSSHTLVIKKVNDHDLGMYECRAENKIGFKGAVIELTGRPMACIFKISPLVSTSTTHNLIWQTESLSPIVEYKLKFRQVPSGNITPQNRQVNLAWNELTIPAEFSEGPIHTIGYTLRGLQPASVYESSVLSRNRYGWSPESKIVRFATGGEVELPNYSTEPENHFEDLEENFLNDLEPPTSLHDYRADRSESRSKSSSSLKRTNLIILVMNFFILEILRIKNLL